MMPRSLLVLAVVALTLCLSGRLSADDGAVHRLVGVAGCSAANCHGGKSLVGGEASAWLTRDVAHRRAYDVLFNETSVRMAKQLGLKAAHTEARCLACHSTETAHPSGAKGERFAVEFGVGCESCHGAAGSWVSRHTDRSWRTLAAAQKQELGFHDLKPASARAEKCAECHVGSPRATVDHDLIAAGHPRLTFEMSAYHALLPKHWDAAAESRRDPAQELRFWAIGHAASAKAMSDIAATRAELALKSGAKQVAPDLAEFDCHACHHDLTEPTRGRPTLRDSLGSPRWGSWSIPPARFAARMSHPMFGANGSAADHSLGQLTKLFQQSRLGTADANTLVLTARQTSSDLSRWSHSLESLPSDATRIAELRHRLLATEFDSEWTTTWDGQAQRYLSLVAISRSEWITSARQTSPSSRLFGQFSERLRFPIGYATPRGFSSDDYQELLRQLRESP